MRTDASQLVPREYEIVGDSNNTHHIKFINPPFNDIIFSYGKVEFKDDDDETSDGVNLAFDYTIHDGTVEQDDLLYFHNEIGDLLVGLMEQSLASHTTIFSGGVDEQNRNNDNQSADNE